MFLFKKPGSKSNKRKKMGKPKKNKITTKYDQRRIHPKELLNILEQVYSNHKVWMFREDLKPVLLSALCFLEKYEKDIINQIDHLFGTGSVISELQFKSSKMIADSLSKEDFRIAYQQLCACIDNYGWSRRRNASLSTNEFILYYTLIRNFISVIEKWEKTNGIRNNEKDYVPIRSI